MHLGYKVKKFREIRDYNQKHMAKQLGIGQTAYSKLETGETKISDERLQKIADVLDTAPEAIKAFDERMVFSINHQKGDYAGHIIINNSFSFDEFIKIVELIVTPIKEQMTQLNEKISMLSDLLEKKK